MSETREPSGREEILQAIVDEAREIEAGKPSTCVRCRQPIMHRNQLYRCAECALPFHQPCIVAHFADHTTTPERAEPGEGDERRSGERRITDDLRRIGRYDTRKADRRTPDTEGEDEREEVEWTEGDGPELLDFKWALDLLADCATTYHILDPDHRLREARERYRTLRARLTPQSGDAEDELADIWPTDQSQLGPPYSDLSDENLIHDARNGWWMNSRCHNLDALISELCERLERLLRTPQSQGEAIGYVVVAGEREGGQPLSSASREIIQGMVWPSMESAEAFIRTASSMGLTLPPMTIHPVGPALKDEEPRTLEDPKP